MQPDTNSNVTDFARVTQIITFALAMSVVIYIVVAWFVVPSMASAGGDTQLLQVLALALAVVSAGHLVGAQVVHQVLLAKARSRGTPQERLGRYRTAIIIAFALREGVALYGLVLSLLSGDPKWATGFGAVALFSMVIGWPRRSVMEELAAEVQPIG
jgi:hypothetical protein